MYRHAQRLSLEFHETYTSGRIIARQTSDLEAIRDLLDSGITGLVRGILYMVFTAVALNLFSVLTGVAKVVVDLGMDIFRTGGYMLDFIEAMTSGSWTKMKQGLTDLRVGFQDMGREIGQDIAGTGDEIAKAWGTDGKIPQALKTGKGKVKEALDETLDIIKQFQNEAQLASSQGEEKKIQQLDIKYAQERAALKKHLEAIGETNKEAIAEAYAALKAKHVAEVDFLQADAHKKSLELIQKYDDDAAALSMQGEDKKLALLSLQHMRELSDLQKHLREIHASEADSKRVLTAEEGDYQAKVQALKLAGYTKVQQLTEKSILTASQAISKSLTGDKAAFADAAKSIINSVAQEAESAVISYYSIAAAKDWAAGNYAGAIVDEAKGFGASALIATAAGVASALIGSGGGASAPSASASASTSVATVSSTPSGTPSASKGGGGMNLTVVIDHMHGDSSYVDMLAEKINDRVERGDVRLVATQVK